MNPEHRHLLNGYATGTLTPAERERLFAAALEDQSLFDALAEEQSLKDLLDDPEARGYLLDELDRQKPQATPVAIPQATRYWLPLSAVMLGLFITGWLWWRNQPTPVFEIATRQSPPPSPVAEGGAARVSPAAQQVTPPPVVEAEKRPSAIRGEEVPPPPPPTVLDSISKKEADAAPARKAGVAEPASADAASPPAPHPAIVALGKFAITAVPTYQLLRLEGKQFLPTDPTARFAAGDVVALRLPYESNPPQVTFGNQRSLALSREGEWYRTESVALASGEQNFVVIPNAGAAAARSRLAAPAEAEANTAAREMLLIRINVP